MKRFSDLTKGEKFTARVIDIRPDTVTIELATGESLTAKSLILPDARIGEAATFMVKDNAKGKISLEMVREGEDNSKSGDNVLEERIKRRSFDMRV